VQYYGKSFRVRVNEILEILKNNIVTNSTMFFYRMIANKKTPLRMPLFILLGSDLGGTGGENTLSCFFPIYTLFIALVALEWPPISFKIVLEHCVCSRRRCRWQIIQVHFILEFLSWLQL